MESRVENKGRKSKREATHYWATKVRYKESPVGFFSLIPKLFAEQERAKANPEDQLGLWDRIRLVFGC